MYDVISRPLNANATRYDWLRAAPAADELQMVSTKSQSRRLYRKHALIYANTPSLITARSSSTLPDVGNMDHHSSLRRSLHWQRFLWHPHPGALVRLQFVHCCFVGEGYPSFRQLCARVPARQG